jgi:phage replication-related protein YjqB (UPF0714/DUF867 family)
MKGEQSMGEQEKQESFDMVGGADGEVEEHNCSNPKCVEYREIAALLSLDLDLLGEAMEDITTLEDLQAQIRYTMEQRDAMLKDPKVRQSRYEASSFLFSLAALD